LKVAIYCRVSTEGQEQDGTSLQTQLEACLKYCQSKNYEVAYQFKEAYSGLSLERPKLNELRELVRSDEIDIVVVYSLDRFSRDPVHGVILMQELEKHSVYLEAATETVDNSEVGKLVFYIKGYAAKLDAERRKDATARGKKALLKAGKLPQGGFPMYGYDWVKEYKKRIIVEREAKVVKRIFEMVASGIPSERVARILNEEGIPSKTGKKWVVSSINRIVKNPAYMGVTYYGKTSGKKAKIKVPKENWYVLPDATPAIVSKELFEQVQELKAKTKELHYNHNIKHEYPLRDFAVCGKCGSPLVCSNLAKNHRYYRCSGSYETARRKKICDARYIRADVVEEAVWNKVKEVLRTPEALVSEVGKQIEVNQTIIRDGSLDQEIKELTRKIKKYPAQEKRLAQAFKLGFSPDIILDEMNQTKKEKEADEAMLVSLIQTKENLLEMDDYEEKLKELCLKIVPDLDNCSTHNKKEAYKYLDLKVKATREAIDIKGYIQPDLSMATQSLPRTASKLVLITCSTC
jgi:site-specific DNA recombinase